jgi:hypothetical protein
MPNTVFLSLLRSKRMKSYGVFIIYRERLIGCSYGRVLRVSLMFYYDEIEDALD